MGINFDEEIRALLILCSLLESWNGLVMVVSNSIPRSSTLKYDDVISVVLSEETRRKSLGGSTSGSALNAQIRGKMIERESNSRKHGKSRGKSKGEEVSIERTEQLLVLWETRAQKERLLESKEK